MTHMVMVDGSKNAEKAFKWVVENTPKSDAILLLHGRERQTVVPFVERTELTDFQHFEHLKKTYENLCKKAENWQMGLVKLQKNFAVKTSPLVREVLMLQKGSTSSALSAQCDCPINIIPGWKAEVEKLAST